VCVTLKGSAVKGDFIQGYSDFDFHVFLRPEVMDGEKNPKIADAIRFQEAFGDVNPEDFGASQFQIYFINSEKYPQDWVLPIEGTYRICWGDLPSAAEELDDSTYLQHAKRFLSNVEHDKQSLVNRFVDKPNSRVPTYVRLLGAMVKGHMYSVAILATSKPKFILRLRLDKLVPIVEKETKSRCFSVFFEHVSKWSLIREDHEYAREAFREGIEALDEIYCWFREIGI
jgi:hypothetical protein